MSLPPYAYVPGHWPHPTRDPEGHAFGRDEGPAAPLEPELWRENPIWLEGIELFERGYYWEAHEAWERLWIAAGRKGATGELLSGLIKLAAAGIKIRQGLTPQALGLGTKASACFARAQAECGAQRWAGLSFPRLQALARQAKTLGPAQASPAEPVVVVFTRALVEDTIAAQEMRAGLETALAYHHGTKHLPGRFAASLGYMDWDTQPDPFRRFAGAPRFALAFEPIGPTPRYEPAFVRGHIDPSPPDAATPGRLLQDSLALSAWKEVPGTRWPLRVNPSSGNLHPTEGYLISGPLAGLHDAPAVYHYAPYLHALELRTQLDADTWRTLAAQLPPGAVLIGLSSIHWREAWKYGERSFRYCQHDVGHALACISIAAAGLGWDTRLLEKVVDDELASLLGIDRQTGPEAEHPDGLVAVFPGGSAAADLDLFQLGDEVIAALRSAAWRGTPNSLSEDHHDWPIIAEVAAATCKHRPPDPTFWDTSRAPNDALELGEAPLALRQIIHQRRSAVAFDGHSAITREAFHQILLKTLPGRDQVPFAALPWRPAVDLLLFVHRVQGVTPGLYALVRDPTRAPVLEAALSPDFAWSRSEACPSSLGLYLLEEGDARRVARQTSCDQAIASDGVFTVAMLAEFRDPLHTHGPWFYRRLYWECGAIGQVLYLEAEASGIRGTGIGCFFDDVTHRAFGLEGDHFQVLYHFTAGAAVDDTRLQTRPPYEHLSDEAPASDETPTSTS